MKKLGLLLLATVLTAQVNSVAVNANILITESLSAVVNLGNAGVMAIQVPAA